MKTKVKRRFESRQGAGSVEENLGVEDETFCMLRDTSLEIRRRNGLEYREAVVRKYRVEYFRGRDLVAYFTEDSTKLDEALQGSETKGLSLEERIKLLVESWMSYGLVVKADRYEADKVPKPGKKRVAKWPKRLELKSEDLEWDVNAFYAWTTKRPLSPWIYLGSFLLVVLVTAVCLFPFAPMWIKWAVVYTSWRLLAFIASIVALRLSIFVAIWILTGRSIWILPLLFEEKPLWESITTLVSETQDEDGKAVERATWWKRLLVVVAICLCLLAIKNFSPEPTVVSGRMKSVNRSVLRFLDMVEMEGMKEKLDGPAHSEEDVLLMREKEEANEERIVFESVDGLIDEAEDEL